MNLSSPSLNSKSRENWLRVNHKPQSTNLEKLKPKHIPVHKTSTQPLSEYSFPFFLLPAGLWMKLMALCMPCKCSTTQLYPQPLVPGRCSTTEQYLLPLVPDRCSTTELYPWPLVLGRCSTTELYPQPSLYYSLFILRQCLTCLPRLTLNSL